MIELAGPETVPYVEGALALRSVSGGIQPLRLGDDTMDFAHEALRAPFVAEATNGIRLRFQTEASSLTLSFTLIVSPRTAFALTQGAMSPPTLDLVVENQLVDRRFLPHHSQPQVVTFEGFTNGNSDVELWLPHNVGMTIHAIRADRPLSLSPDSRPRMVIHGSSISHDALATGPSDTWPAALARAQSWHLTHLGFRGECHMDPFVARAIAETPADVVILELGINVHNFQSMRGRTFLPAVHGFLQTVRDGHPHVPLVVITPVYGAEREVQASSVTLEGETLQGDLTLAVIRQLLGEAVTNRQRHGDADIVLIDGLSLLGPEEAAHFPDGLHPNGEGTGLILERLLPLLPNLVRGVPRVT